MTRAPSFLAIPTSAFLAWCSIAVGAFLAQEPPRYAGPTEQGFLLPNGWTLKPAGRPVPLTDLPLNIIALADNRHALAATAGYNAHELSLIDLQEAKIVDRQAVSQSWFGLAASAEGDRIWWSGGGANVLHAFRLSDRRLARAGAPEPDRKTARKGEQRHFRAGIAVDHARKVLYSLDIDAGTISAVDLVDLKELKSGPAGTRPYDVVLSRAGNQLFVSDWAGRAVSSGRTRRPPHRRTDCRRRTSQPDRRLPDRRPDFRRLRIEQLGLGHRHPARDRHRDHPHRPLPSPPKAAHPTPWPSRPTARRCSSPTPTTTTSRSSTSPLPTGARSKDSSRPAGIPPPWRSPPTASSC